MKTNRLLTAIVVTAMPIAFSAAVSFAAPTNVALGKPVTLNGASFFTGGWGGLIVSADTIVDGTFFARNHQWDQGPVWWDSNDDEDRWIEIDLQGTYVIESLIVQADDNDAYKLYYWDIGSSSWQLLWDVPNYDVVPDPDNLGMQTRPNPDDDTVRYTLASHIVTNALKFEGDLADTGDKLFSVSEIQAYGEVFLGLSGWIFMPPDVPDFGYSLDEDSLLYFYSFVPVWNYNLTTGEWNTEGAKGLIYVDWPFIYEFDTGTLWFALPPESGLWVYHFSTGQWEVLPRIIP